MYNLINIKNILTIEISNRSIKLNVPRAWKFKFIKYMDK